MSANRKGLSVTERHVLRSVVIAVLFVLSGVLGHIPASVPYVKTLMEWAGYSIVLLLLSEWMIRIFLRVRQRSICYCLLAVAGLCIFWYMARTLKWSVAGDELMRRYLWYLYYVPIVLLPLLSLLTAFCVGRPPSYHVHRRWLWLFVPAGILILLVLTNDLHQWVFAFQKDFVNSTSSYIRRGGYYVIAAWSCVLIMAALAVLYQRCKIPDSRRRILRPFLFVFVALAVVYAVAYPFFSDTYLFKCMDLTTLFCGVIYGVFNTCAAVGLIQTNSRYEALYSQTDIDTWIMDENLQVAYTSKGVVLPPRECMETALRHTVSLPDHRQLKCMSIYGGYVFWIEDVSAVHALLEQLQEDKELLQDKESLLQAEIEVKKKQAAVEKQLDLYTKIDSSVGAQAAAMEQVLQAMGSDNAEQSLKTLCLLCAYIKRKSNLLLLGEHNASVPVRELSLCLQESCNALALFGVQCNLNPSDEGEAPIETLIDLYAAFEAQIEAQMPGLEALYIKVSQTPAEVMVHLVMQPEAGEALTLRLCGSKGGGAE